MSFLRCSGCGWTGTGFHIFAGSSIPAEKHVLVLVDGPPPDLDADLAALRMLLWLRHGCPSSVLYGDDGEMQCAKCLIDFKRATVPEIEASFERLGMATLDEVQCSRCKAGEPLVTEPKHEHYRRADGNVLCGCSKPYRKHSHSEHRDWQGDPWLNRLCDGELVKL